MRARESDANSLAYCLGWANDASEQELFKAKCGLDLDVPAHLESCSKSCDSSTIEEGAGFAQNGWLLFV
jgi:hypothetical protein